MGPYIPYDLLQTKGEKCAKFGSDRLRNVDLYKFHTNKQTFIFIYKINNGIIIKSISTLMCAVWHVDRYKITFKLIINRWPNEIL